MNKTRILRGFHVFRDDVIASLQQSIGLSDADQVGAILVVVVWQKQLWFQKVLRGLKADINMRVKKKFCQLENILYLCIFN